MQRVNYRERITIEPGKRGGKPCIRGMRIAVYDVLDYLASGMTEGEIREYARDNGFAIASKDEDFHQLSFPYESSPKVIWLKLV